jgi:tRNA(Ile)-lysidine synthase
VPLDPDVAAVRLAVRRALPATDGTAPVLVACSGGADSLALLAATVFETRRDRRRVLGVTVDHGLQDGSAGHADRVVAQMATLGADETVSVRVRVEASGKGPEAAAREARYAVLAEVAQRTGAGAVLLGHTLDDQAETVLLGLTRGSGGRSLAGMRPAFEVFLRPLLALTRARLEAACRAEGIGWWTDPHNADPRFTRARLRHRVLPVLEAELGPGVATALARTAEALREDAETLDALTDAAWPAARVPDPSGDGPAGDGPAGDGLDVDVLAGLGPGIRHRLLRRAAVRAGSPPGELFRVHVLAMDELVTGWHGQGQVDLPGHLHLVRDRGVLRLRRTGRPDG